MRGLHTPGDPARRMCGGGLLRSLFAQLRTPGIGRERLLESGSGARFGKQAKIAWRNLGLQGELIGNGVQGNKYRLPGLDIRLFSIFDIDRRRYLDFPDFQEVTQKLGLQTVPVVEKALRLDHTVQQLVDMAKGNSLLNKDALREGLVFRTLTEDQDPEIGRLSFKALNPDFLLAHDE